MSSRSSVCSSCFWPVGIGWSAKNACTSAACSAFVRTTGLGHDADKSRNEIGMHSGAVLEVFLVQRGRVALDFGIGAEVPQRADQAGAEARRPFGLVSGRLPTETVEGGPGDAAHERAQR